MFPTQNGYCHITEDKLLFLLGSTRTSKKDTSTAFNMESVRILIKCIIFGLLVFIILTYINEKIQKIFLISACLIILLSAIVLKLMSRISENSEIKTADIINFKFRRIIPILGANYLCIKYNNAQQVKMWRIIKFAHLNSREYVVINKTKELLNKALIDSKIKRN